MMEETLDNMVQEHRKAAGLTQEELAHSIGVTRQTIIAIEKGNYTPSVALAIRLAHTFKTPVETLFKLH